MVPVAQLHDFIAAHRQEIIRRARAMVVSRAPPIATTREPVQALPNCLMQLGDVLRKESPPHPADGATVATKTVEGAGDPHQEERSVAQVVHDYGDVCRAITDLARDLGLPIGTEDSRPLHWHLDNAIASAVSERARQLDADRSAEEIRRRGFFTHELRNYLGTAMMAFDAVKSGRSGMAGSIDMLERSLRRLCDLMNYSVTEVRLMSGMRPRQRLPVAAFLEEAASDASADAARRGHELQIERVDDRLLVNVDGHLFASALSNLLQNALKFTRPSSRVWLRVRVTDQRVAIEVEDQCGGLPPDAAEVIFRPFEQRGSDRTGLGLGLAISRQAIEADGGTLSLRDMPGQGCVFTVDMPLASGAATNGRSIRSRKQVTSPP